MYLNGSICECLWEDSRFCLGIVFPELKYKETVVVIPLCLEESGDIQLLLGNETYSICFSSIQRIREEDILSPVDTLDSEAIKEILGELFLLMDRKVSKVRLVRKSSNAVSSSLVDEESTSVSAVGRVSYSREDYEFVVRYASNDIEKVIAKYGLRDKQAVYRLKHYLKQRFEVVGENGQEKGV